MIRKIKKFFGAKQGSDEEFRFHLQQQTELNIAKGMSPNEARRQALIAFGGVQQAREAVIEQRRAWSLESAVQDFRHGLRILRNAPGFTVIAVAILALGIGANAAIFSAVNAVLFARWPVPHQEQLVMVKEMNAASNGWLVSVPDFQDYQRRQTTFQDLSLWMNKSVNLIGQERPDRLIGGFVSANYFRLMGVKAVVGRTFLDGEDQPGAATVAVISYATWQNRFGGDPNMLGRQLILNSEPYIVVGILPKDFALSPPFSSEEVYVTAQHDADYEVNRKIKSFLVLGRLKADTSAARAALDLNTTAQLLAHDFPLENAGIRIEIEPLQELATQGVRTPLLVLLGAVALVLLIVCANVANLLLARGAAREREIAVRSALGAARGRLMRQFLCESMVLAFMGGLSGILLAQLLLKGLVAIAPVNVSLTESAGLDLRVLLFAAGISIFTGLIFGISPSVQFSRVNLLPALSNSNRAGSTRASGRLRAAFVVLQVAMSMMLVVSATLLVKSFHALVTADPGFMPDHLLTMEYRLPPSKYKTPETQLNFHRQMLNRVQQVPGVVSAGLIQALPFSGNWSQTRFLLPGQPASDQRSGVSAFYNAVTPEYFSTIGIPLLAGRVLDAHDDAAAPAVAIVNRAFAEKYFAPMDPVGQELSVTEGDPLALAAEHRTTKRARIIGVVGNAKQRFVREDLQPQVYFTYAQVIGTFGTLVIRTAVDPMSLTEAVRQAVWSVDRDQPVWKIRTLDALIEKDTAADRFAMLLMTVLSALALLLSALGTYGILSHNVSQRTQELGIRLALGAPRGKVLNLVLVQGFKLLAVGSALGFIGSLVCARLISSLLYGIKPEDITAFALGIFVMIAIGMLASYLPARRATRVDPMAALRNE